MIYYYIATINYIYKYDKIEYQCTRSTIRITEKTAIPSLFTESRVRWKEKSVYCDFEQMRREMT